MGRGDCRQRRRSLGPLCDDRRVEILITDLNVPEMDFYELTDQTARLRPDLRILLLSSREGDGHGLPILGKPFLKEDLARTMSQTAGLC